MEFSSSHMETSRHQFDSFCRKVLRDFSCDIERQRNRQRQREVCFSALSEQKMEQLFTKDEYPSDHTYFYVLGYPIKVENGRLAEAIASLSADKRDIFLLLYFLDMNDREIAEVMNMVRRTVQRRRTSSIQRIKDRMEAE